MGLFGGGRGSRSSREEPPSADDRARPIEYPRVDEIVAALNSREAQAAPPAPDDYATDASGSTAASASVLTPVELEPSNERAPVPTVAVLVDPTVDPTLVDPRPFDPALAVEVTWTFPGPSDATLIADGPYAGRVQAGEIGAMLRILPSVRSKLAGAHVPDSVVDAGVVSPSVSVGAVSVKGPSHHQSGSPRQDAYAFASSDDWVVMAIADGVSEGRLSHVAADKAATVAATEALRLLSSGLPDDLDWSAVTAKCRDAVRALGVRRASQQAAADQPFVEPSDRQIAGIMATTCDLLITPTQRTAGSLRITRVRVSGDGSFYILDPAKGWGVVGRGKDTGSSTVDNSVLPLPLDTGAPIVTSWELHPGQAAVLCTDGFGDVIGEGARPVGRYLSEAWRRPLDTSALLHSASLVNTNADDDRTAAIVWATA